MPKPWGAKIEDLTQSVPYRKPMESMPYNAGRAEMEKLQMHRRRHNPEK